MRAPPARLRPVLSALLPLALAACGGGGARLANQASYGRHYDAPGPPADPWRPYIQEASERFHVPQGWIRAIIRQESGGHEYLHGRPVTSDAGAMGLMQLMPATYAELRDRFGLGNDPYDPARQHPGRHGLYRRALRPLWRTGLSGRLQCGPRRMDEYNDGRGALPHETIAYLASVAPALATEGPMTGKLAVYAQAGSLRREPVQVYAAYARPLGACWRDPDAAYDPDDVCNRKSAPSAAPVVTGSEPGAVTRQGVVLWGSALAARAPAAVPAPPHAARFAFIPSAQAEPMRMDPYDARWGVQVGAFADPAYARQVAAAAQRAASQELAPARIVLGTTPPERGALLYRARLVGITHPAAASACTLLTEHRWDCLTVPPGG